MKLASAVKKSGSYGTDWVKRLSSLCVLAGVWLGMSLPALAYRLVAVRGPGDLTRPKDGKLYPFVVVVTGKYTRKDFGKGPIPIKQAGYWEEDGNVINFDDEIDIQPEGAVIPEPSPDTKRGDTWTIQVTFQVGCTDEGEVFGPSGKTKEGKLKRGFFTFRQGRGIAVEDQKWGYNTVTCEEASSQSSTEAVPPSPPESAP